jgi:hypothetical protein
MFPITYNFKFKHNIVHNVINVVLNLQPANEGANMVLLSYDEYLHIRDADWVLIA